MKIWNMIEKGIDGLVEIMGKIGWILVLYCMVLGVSDVFLRYVLNAPSLWIGTTIQAAMVLMACVGGAYALNHNAFVKLDLFYANFSRKKKAFCDILTVVYTLLFLGVLIWKGIAAAQLSIKFKQMTPTGVPIPIYPIKTFIPFAGGVVLLVVIKKLVNDIITLFSSESK
ncbi:TRAP transporter small permease subunit [Desulfogranum mediterraneum]|uniref:TRAP transporter small permease subunit n=1 Tax=Desulfogranum mediterraneum TaxID=160661 RepID=UPI0003FC779A|nr:TRAP transporter small permease subunit [Desulfogranum mediterraneum]